MGGSQLLDRVAFGREIVSALSELRADLGLDAALLAPVSTSTAGQTALRPLASGLKLDKMASAVPAWKPRTVREALTHWLASPRGKPLGE